MRSRSWTGPLLPALFALLLAAVPSDAAPELFLLVREDATWTRAPDRASLRRLYLGRRTRLEGRRVVLAAMPPGSPSRERFNERILRMTEDELARYWIEQVLLGEALPPLEVEDLEGMARLVRERPGAIGYVLEEAAALEAIPGIRALPLEPARP